MDKVTARSKEEGPQKALWVFDAVDKADTGISAVSGLGGAWKMYQATTGGERLDALETDTQQAADAVMKAVAIAYCIHKLYDGSPTEKIARFRESPAGQAMLFYYAAIEIGLPFTDNAVQGGAAVVKKLYDDYGKDQIAKLAAMVGQEEADAASGVLDKLMGAIGTMVDLAGEHLGPIANAGAQYLPTAMDVGDKAAGVVATGADLLHVYRYLGSRLVAEACIRRALEDQGGAGEQAQAALTRSNPSNVEVKYTRSKDDLPDAPAKKKGCFGLFVVLLAAGLTAAGTTVGLLL